MRDRRCPTNTAFNDNETTNIIILTNNNNHKNNKKNNNNNGSTKSSYDVRAKGAPPHSGEIITVNGKPVTSSKTKSKVNNAKKFVSKTSISENGSSNGQEIPVTGDTNGNIVVSDRVELKNKKQEIPENDKLIINRDGNSTLDKPLSTNNTKTNPPKEKLWSNITASKEKISASCTKLSESCNKFSENCKKIPENGDKISNGMKRLSYGSSKLSGSTSKLSGSNQSLSNQLKKQYPDVVGVAEKLTRFFCRSRTHTYHVQRRQKGLSLPPTFSQTTGNWVSVANLRQLDGGILDPDDRLCDVIDDRDQIIAVYTEHPLTAQQQRNTATPSIDSTSRTATSSAAQSRSHTPDIFQEAEHQFSPFTRTDIEVTREELNNTLPPLHVRRGSEPTLNRLSPIPPDTAPPGVSQVPSLSSHTVVGSLNKKSAHNKRWSAAPVIDDDALAPPPSSTPMKDHDDATPMPRVFVYPGEERGEGSGEEKNPSSSSASSSASSHHSATNTAFSRFARDNNRCSIQVLSDNPSMSRWADAAERIGGSGMSYNEMRRRDPVGGASTSPHHSRQASLDTRHLDTSVHDKTPPRGLIYDTHSKPLHQEVNHMITQPLHTLNDYQNLPPDHPLLHSHMRNKSIDVSSTLRSHSNDSRPYDSRSLPHHERSHSHDSYTSEPYKHEPHIIYSAVPMQGPPLTVLKLPQDQQFTHSNKDVIYGQSPSKSKDFNTSPSKEKLPEQRVLVVLNNGCGPLGIHVIPSPLMGRGGGEGGGLLVEGVEEGGRVAQDGRIQVHDRIIDINGHSLLNTTFHQAQEIFKDAMQAPALRLLVSKSRANTEAATAGDRGQHGYPVVTVAASCGPPKVMSLSSRTQTVMLQSSSRRPGRHISLCLTKGQHGLGFSITTRDNPARGHAPIYIKGIMPVGAAIEDGTLRIGDKIVSVNGKDVTGLNQTEVANMLRKVPVGGRAILEVSRQERGVEATAPNAPKADTDNKHRTGPQDNRLNDDHPPSPQLPRQIGVEKAWEDSLLFPWKQREIMTLDIPIHDSERAGLGVSVKGKTSSGNNGTSGPVDLGIFVKNVIFGGAASRDGRLRENDQLVNINGLSLLGKPNSEAMNTLRVAMHEEGPVPGMITLTIARRVGGSVPAANGEEGGHKTNSLPRSGRDSSASNSTGTENMGILGGARTAPTTPTPGDAYVTSVGGVDPLSGVHQHPVLHRLTGNTAALRNESYYQATHDTWNNSELAAALPPATPINNGAAGREACVGSDLGKNTHHHHQQHGLGSPTVNQPQRDTLIIQDEYTHGSSQLGQTNSCLDETYNSQSSLDAGDGIAGFSRDQFGRQSMSEKRHATLDAKSTDTYQRNKKAREDREKQKHQLPADGDAANAGTASGEALGSPQQQPSSPAARRFTPHLSLPGYVRKAGVLPPSPPASHMYSKNSQSLTRYARKAATAAAAAVYAKKAAHAAANSSGNVGSGSIAEREEGGEKKPETGGNNVLFGMLRGMSRSLERPRNGCQTNTCLPPNSHRGTSQSSDIGPGLGMKKSSSLESLQTMVQEVTLSESSSSRSGSGRVPRGRGCNESFRAAVDRSYEAPLGGPDAEVMDTLDEEDVEGPRSSAAHTSHVDGNRTLNKTNNANSKKNKGLLKGLGSMFRFGKHRKTLDNNLLPDSLLDTAQQPFDGVNQRGPSYDLAMADQEPSSFLPEDGVDVGHSRTERMHQLRAEHQRRHAQRNRTYPSDTAEFQQEQAKSSQQGQQIGNFNIHDTNLSYSCHTEPSTASKHASIISPDTSQCHVTTLDNLPLSPIVTPHSPAASQYSSITNQLSSITNQHSSITNQHTTQSTQHPTDTLSVSAALAARCSHMAKPNCAFQPPMNSPVMRSVVSSSAFTNNSPNRHSFHGGMLTKHACLSDLNKFDNSIYSKVTWLGDINSAHTSSKNNLNRSYTICLPSSPSREVIKTCTSPARNTGPAQLTNVISCSSQCTSLFCRNCFRDERDSSRLTCQQEHVSKAPSVYVVNANNCSKVSTSADNTSRGLAQQYVWNANNLNTSITTQVPNGAYVYNNVIYSRPVKKTSAKMCEGIDLQISNGTCNNNGNGEQSLRVVSEEIVTMNGLSSNSLKNFQRSSTIGNLNTDLVSVSRENTVSGSSIQSSSTQASTMNTLMDDVSVVHKPPLPPRNRQNNPVLSNDYKVPPPPKQAKHLKPSSDKPSNNSNFQYLENNSQYSVPPPPIHLRNSNHLTQKSNIHSTTEVRTGASQSRNDQYQIPPPPKHLRTRSQEDTVTPIASDPKIAQVLNLNVIDLINTNEQKKLSPRGRSLSLSENSSSRKRKLDANAQRRKSDKSLLKDNFCSENKENVPETHPDKASQQNSGFPSFGALNGNFPFTFTKSLSCLNGESSNDIANKKKHRKKNALSIEESKKDNALTVSDNMQNEVTFSRNVANQSETSTDYENISTLFPQSSDASGFERRYQNNLPLNPYSRVHEIPNKPVERLNRDDPYGARSSLLQEIKPNNIGMNPYYISVPQPIYVTSRAGIAQPLSSGSSNSSSGSSSGRSSSLPRMGVKSVAAAKLCSRNTAVPLVAPRRDHPPPPPRTPYGYAPLRGLGPPCPAPVPPPKVLPNPLAPLASTNILEESRFWRLDPLPSSVGGEAPSNAPEEYGLPPHRPGSRGVRGALLPPAASNSLQYAHYANYQQIQQHLRSEEQERLKQLASQQYRDFREKHHNRRMQQRRARPYTTYCDDNTQPQWQLLHKLEQSFIDEAIVSSRECREYQSQRGTRDSHARPVSNYYEYESVQAVLSHIPTAARLEHTAALHATVQHPALHNTPLPHARSNTSSNNTNNTTNIIPSTAINSISINKNNITNISSNNRSVSSSSSSSSNNNNVSNNSVNVNSNTSSMNFVANFPNFGGSNSNGGQSRGGYSGHHNSLPRRPPHLHQHFTDNLPIVTGNRQQHQHYHSTKHSPSKQHPQQEQQYTQRQHNKQPPPPPPSSAHPYQQHPTMPSAFHPAAKGSSGNHSLSQKKSSGMMYPPPSHSRHPPPPPHSHAPTHHNHHQASQPYGLAPVPGSKV